MRSVLVVGARGVLGTLIADAFEGAGWEVRRGARRPPATPGWQLVDLDRPDTLERALDGVDVTVTAVPDPDLRAEWHVLEHGGTLVSVVAMTGAETGALREAGAQALGTVVPNAGIVPGVTNLVAADLLKAHPQADRVELVMTASAAGSHGRAGGAFVHANLHARRRHRTVVVPLPAPYGTRRCIEFAEGCDGWLGSLAEGREVHTYLCFGQRPQQLGLLAANALGACRLLPRSQFVTEQRGGDGGSRDAVAEWVAVTHGRDRVAAATVECEGDYRATAAIAVAFAELALEREQPAGCRDPQELFTLAELAPRLAREGIRVVARDLAR